ncbi:MAG: lasso RiPP family leader peptide-containing protein [Acidobacteriota bacterium]
MPDLVFSVFLPPAEPTPPGPKRRYETPRLIVHGDLRTFTLGPSPGVGESGNPAIFKAQ